MLVSALADAIALPAIHHAPFTIRLCIFREALKIHHRGRRVSVLNGLLPARVAGIFHVHATSMAAPSRTASSISRKYALAAVGALFIVLSTFSTSPVHATGAQGSTPPLYYCAAGLCVGPNNCPMGSVSALKLCSEADYYVIGVTIHGPITFVGASYDCCGDATLWWIAQDGTSQDSIFGTWSRGQDAPAVDRNLGNKGCSSCGGTMHGNPVNISTGNKYADEDDYDGEGTFPLAFHRYYNSAGSGDGATGNRWGHTYSRVLLMQNASEIKLFRDDGEILYFEKCGTAWCANADETGTLTAQTNSSGYITSWQYTDEHNVTESYDGTGLFLAETNNAGLTHTVTYDSNGRLSTVTDSFGRMLVLHYNTSNLISQLTLPDSQAVAYAYDSSNNLSSVTYPGNLIRTYFYDESANVASGANTSMLTGIQDEASQRFATYQYDNDSRATLSEHAGGADSNQFTYNSNGTAMVTDALGDTRTYAIQMVLNVNHLSTVSGMGCTGCGLFASYAYDSAGDFTSTTDFNGNQTLYTIDSYHLLDSRVDAPGSASQRTTNFTWNTALRVPLTRAVQDADGNTTSNTQWVYNANGQTLARCDIDPANGAASGYSCSNGGSVPAGVRRTSYTYCTSVDTSCPIVGLMLTATGARTDLTQTTSYSYYTSSSANGCGTPGAACYQPGDLYQVTNTLGHVTTIASYDADGRITRLTDANGINTDMTYTPRGWLATRTVGGAQTSFTYTPYGAVQTVTDPDGVTTTYGYDAAHRLVKITDALGNTIQYTLDAAGDKTAERVDDPSGTLHKSLTRTFNTLGQLTSVADGLNHTVFNATATGSYDANGNLIQSSDGLNIARQMGYDALNRLVQTIDNYNGTN